MSTPTLNAPRLTRAIVAPYINLVMRTRAQRSPTGARARQRIRLWVGLWVIALLSLGCGGGRGSSGALPGWVMTPPLGCAVGSLEDQGTPHLTRVGAVTRARAELARQVQVQIESVMTLYQEVGALGGRVATRDEMTSQSAQSTRAELEGTRARDISIDRGVLYALVCVERARALRIISEVKRRVEILAPGSTRATRREAQSARDATRQEKRSPREALRARAQRALSELEARLGER